MSGLLTGAALSARLVEKGKRVELAPIREAFERLYADGLITQSALARELGWTTPKRGYKNGRGPDTSRVVRALGMAREKAGKGRGRYAKRETTCALRAERLTLAIAACAGVDPVDLGL